MACGRCSYPPHTGCLVLSIVDQVVGFYFKEGSNSYYYNFCDDYQFPLYVFGPQLILIAAGGGNFSSAPLANIGPTE